MQFDMNDSYQGAALAAPSREGNPNGFSRWVFASTTAAAKAGPNCTRDGMPEGMP